MAGAVNLEGPSRVFHLTDLGPGFLERRPCAGERELLRVDAAVTNRTRDLTIAAARRRVRREAAVRLRKGQHRGAGMLEPLAKQIGRDIEDFSRLRPGKVHDLAENVRESVRAIETLEHRQCASDLDFFNQHRVLDIRINADVQADVEAVCKALKAHVQAFDGALPDVKDVVDRHTVGPGVQPTSEVELRQAGHDTDQDLLCRVFRILLRPQHPQGQVVDATL